MNDVLLSRQDCDRRRAHVIDPQCAHYLRNQEQRLEDGEAKRFNI